MQTGFKYNYFHGDLKNIFGGNGNPFNEKKTGFILTAKRDKHTIS